MTFLFPLEYRADAQVFIISQSQQGVDPYTTVKSAERIGENLSELLKTDDFFVKVSNQDGYNLDVSEFTSLNDRKRRKLWEQSVHGSVVYGTGVFSISAYHRSQEQAKALAGAAANTLVANGWQYVGGDVIIRLVNPPVVTQYPVRPNLLVNIVLGFLFGVLFISVFVIRKR